MQITKIFGSFIILSLLLIGCTNDDGDTPFNTNPISNRQAVGNAANDLLSDINYKSLTVEIVAAKGYEPTEKGIQIFKQFLEDRLHKPDGITINQRTIQSSELAPFSIEEIHRIESANRTFFDYEDEITVFIYFADGSHKDDSDTNITLGSAYLNTSMVIYEKTIQDLSSKPSAPLLSTLEATTLNHEFAHLLGLVNNGTKAHSHHEDLKHKNHCNVKKCLMEATMVFESGQMYSLDGGVPKLDAKCIADLRRNGGK